MRPFLYALTFSLGLCLLVPAAARGRGALAGPDPPEMSRADIRAEKDADQASVFLIGSLAALVALVVVVQFVREVRGSPPPPRVIMYSARTDTFDGTDSYDGASSHHGLAEVEDGDDYDDHYDTADF
jgi:hypothetical protein